MTPVNYGHQIWTKILHEQLEDFKYGKYGKYLVDAAKIMFYLHAKK